MQAYNTLLWRAGVKSYETSRTGASIILYNVCWWFFIYVGSL